MQSLLVRCGATWWLCPPTPFPNSAFSNALQQGGEAGFPGADVDKLVAVHLLLLVLLRLPPPRLFTLIKNSDLVRGRREKKKLCALVSLCVLIRCCCYLFLSLFRTSF